MAGPLQDQTVPIIGRGSGKEGMCSYYDIGDARRAAWSYEDAWAGVERISGMVSSEPDKIAVSLDGTQLKLESGQSVIPHGPDRDLTTDEASPARQH